MSSPKRFRKKLLVTCLAAALASSVPLAWAGVGASNPGQRPSSSHRSGRAASHAEGAGPNDVRPLFAHGAGPNAIGTLVTNCNDSGPGSLRQVIADATYAERISLRGLACSTITLASAIDVHANNLVVVGAGTDKLTIDGNGSTPLFRVDAPFFVMGFLRLQNGYSTADGGCITSTGGLYFGYTQIAGCHVHTPSGDARGGAIFASGRVDVRESVITSNLAEVNGATNALGGAIFATDYLYARDSTFDSNEARSIKYSTGGAAYVSNGDGLLFGTTISNNTANNVGGISFPGGGVSMYESTISGNVAHGFVGGIYARAASVIDDSTIAFNCAGYSEVTTGYQAAAGLQLYQAGVDLSSSIVANNTLCAGDGVAYDIGYYGDGFVHGDHNLVVQASVSLPEDTIRQDPMLAPLAANGVLRRTHALQPGSPAIDTGASLLLGLSDERGAFFPRLVGSATDIGAYENQDDRTVFVATSCDDSGPGTLRDLAAMAISGDVIDLSQLGCSRITLTSGAIGTHPLKLSIKGPGSDRLTIDGSDMDRILAGPFDFSSFLRVEGIAFEHGYSNYGVAGGACINVFGSFVGIDTRFEQCISRAPEDSACEGGALRVWGDASITRSEFRNNSCSGGTGFTYGGAIWSHGNIALDHSVVADNSAIEDTLDNAKGGAFSTYREARIAFSTISGNHATRAGAGYAYRLFVTQSTVSGNSADTSFGGLSTYMGGVYNSTIALNTTPAADNSAAGFFAAVRGDIESSIFFGNTVGADAYDVGSSTGFLFGASNLVGASPWALPADTISGDPLLGPLQDNGGPTPTHLLGSGSPAIDTGNNALGFETDQRGAGFPRVIGTASDIGAVETNGADPADPVFRNGFDDASAQD